MKKIATIIAAHDGLVSLVTGVGVVVNSFVEAFQEIKLKVNKFKEHEIKLLCLAPYLDRKSIDYNKEIEQITKNSCRINNGILIDIPTFSDGSSQSSIWGGTSEQWNSASLSAASYILGTSKDYDLILLFANDTIFSSIRRYIPNLKNLRVIWVPHSLGKVFKDEFSNETRLDIENKSIEALLISECDYIGYISNSFKETLRKDYGVDNARLLPLINGLYFNSFRYTISNAIVNENFIKYRIPNDKKLIFAWGRCVYQKGYDILIPTYKKFLNENPDYNLVLLMPIETSIGDYVNNIKKEISKIPEDSITAIYEFSDTLPYSILHHKNLQFVIFPSRFEGAPITALEALAFSGDNVRFVYSLIPPLLELFKDNKRAIPIHNLTIDSLYESMLSVTKSNLTEIITKSNMPNNIIDNYAASINTIMENERI
ncbi:MAG TPA: glycosyltransferase family 4 protein [Candidatus Nanoarchaeia archaeon]|nr:glycosyltransferase family 4 protein [Candidatus Nanoarchaeia archaeon]